MAGAATTPRNTYKSGSSNPMKTLGIISGLALSILAIGILVMAAFGGSDSNAPASNVQPSSDQPAASAPAANANQAQAAPAQANPDVSSSSSSNDTSVKPSSWFETQSVAIGSANSDLISKLAEVNRAHGAYVKDSCHGNDNANCEKAWDGSGQKEAAANKADRAKAGLDSLVSEYNAAASIASAEVLGAHPKHMDQNPDGTIITPPPARN